MEAKPWMLDELAHAGPEHLDPGFVAGFDRKQGYPDFSADVSVLAAHGAGQEATVVDLRGADYPDIQRLEFAARHLPEIA